MPKANLLVNGAWRKVYDIAGLTLNGIRRWVKADKGAEFEAERGRYHLYVSMACPWSHRAILVHRLKGLEGVVRISTVATVKADESWRFDQGRPDPLHPSFTHLHQVYTQHDARITSRVSVPVLWDTKKQEIVSTESADIMLMFNGEFNAFARHPDLDFYPEALREQIESMNTLTFEINAGVYRCAMAEDEGAYLTAKEKLFAALARVEAHLAEREYLVGDQMTTADLRLFPTLVRFDQIYYPFFRCNDRRLMDCPNLKKYLERLARKPGLLDTVDWQENMDHYYSSFPQLDSSVRPNEAVPENLRGLLRPVSPPSTDLFRHRRAAATAAAAALDMRPATL